jgi:hypothetical protein
MGSRREPRKTVAVAVRIFGADRDGKVFSENATTGDVSHSGVRLTGLHVQLKPEEIVGLSYGNNKVHFKVKWMGAPGTPTAGSAGLLNLTPEKPLWDFALPGAEPDPFLATRTERRKWPRVKCSISVELQTPGKPVIWGKASDLSQGGCFIEMSIPLPAGTTFDMSMWLNQTKLRLSGQVASLAPGFGNGVRFLVVSPQQAEQLQRFIESLSPLQRPNPSSAKGHSS